MLVRPVTYDVIFFNSLRQFGSAESNIKIKMLIYE